MVDVNILSTIGVAYPEQKVLEVRVLGLSVIASGSNLHDDFGIKQ